MKRADFWLLLDKVGFWSKKIIQAGTMPTLGRDLLLYTCFLVTVLHNWSCELLDSIELFLFLVQDMVETILDVQWIIWKHNVVLVVAATFVVLLLPIHHPLLDCYYSPHRCCLNHCCHTLVYTWACSLQRYQIVVLLKFEAISSRYVSQHRNLLKRTDNGAGPSGLAVISLQKEDSLLDFECTWELKRFQ
jgi:hypothetical protein